ncbi:MAG: hypothetical protein EOP05_07260 [Proteobacteria bacterium]|nr:MAG: hypothetical protein EOP05_07260 [Pseudomonadota bacterium]
MANNSGSTDSKTTAGKSSEVADEMKTNDPKGQKGNGNNYDAQPTKTGSAQTGGPGIDKAQDRKPPGATR